MNNYFVSYSYMTLGANFAENYGFKKVKATNAKEAIAKVRQNAPYNARYFKARAI